MRILHLDCFSGIAGDMAVSALHDLGVEEEVFHGALAALHLPEHVHLHFTRAMREGISGWRLDVHEHHHEHPHDHAHTEGHGHGDGHAHVHGRSYAQIRRLIEASSLPTAVAARSSAVFRRIAVAEGRIHGVDPEEVEFHEVGAVDSIADIVCFCAGLEALGVQRVTASRLVEGSGTIACAHGSFPLPAPATLALLEGIPLAQCDEPGERITPTGAALLAEYAQAFGPMPGMRVEAIGYGVGAREIPGRPNVLRAVVGRAAGGIASDEVVQIEANLDDLTPELAAAAAARLLAEGALDAWITPVLMKKGRPGFILAVLARPSDAQRVSDLLLRETTTFGVRSMPASRLKLERDSLAVATPFGPISIKVGRIGGEMLHATPEFEDCRRAAEAFHAPLPEVYRAALAAAAGLAGSVPERSPQQMADSD
jgi:hypothetical protein